MIRNSLGLLFIVVWWHWNAYNIIYLDTVCLCI